MKRAFNLSVVLPVYNAEDTIEDCLVRLIAALDDGMELIIVDDGSEDDTRRRVELFLRSYNRTNIIFCKKQNGGVSSARNFGLRKASGEYVGFADVDDVVAPEMYRKLVGAALRDKLDVSGCDFYEIIGTKKINSKYHYDNNALLGEEATREYLLDRISNSVWDKIFKKRLIEGLEFNEELTIGEDILFCLQAFMRAKKVKLLDNALYGYVQNDNSAMHSQFNKIWQYNEVIAKISNEDREALRGNCPDEFQYFELEMGLRTIHAISMSSADKSRKIALLKKVLRNIDVNGIIRDERFPRYARLEMRFLSLFGPEFHMAMMPWYKRLRQIVR